MKYTILSPDGFSINFEGGFTSYKKALAYLKQWMQQYKIQGYYSSMRYGRIHLLDLQDYCELITNK